MFSPLEEAIVLHRNAMKQGQEIFIFPSDCDPNAFYTELAYIQPPSLGEGEGLTNLAILERYDQSRPIAN